MAIRNIAAALLAVGVLFAEVPAQAQLVTADRDRIASELRARDLVVEQLDDDPSYPKLKTSSQGYNWEVWFFDCNESGGCTGIQFYAGFADPTIGVDQINSWNRDWRFCRAYIAQNSAANVEMDVSMVGDGISQSTFTDDVDVFESCMTRFADYAYGR